MIKKILEQIMNFICPVFNGAIRMIKKFQLRIEKDGMWEGYRRLSAFKKL